jgi:hypothetical protein
MPIVAPTYISDRTLPYASDIFYHDRLTYFLPTGLHPIEAHSIAGFPGYCSGASIALPKWVWDFCYSYFENTINALQCLKTLAPLRERHITVVATAYPRDRAAIERSKEILRTHPLIRHAIERVDLDMAFVSREVMSHVLFEIFLEDGYNGAVQYFKNNSVSTDATLELVAAVLANRLRLFCSDKSPLLVYEHSWYPAIAELASVESNSPSERTDADIFEHFTYKLFETVLSPLFGRIDSPDKAKMVSLLADKQAISISALKTACRRIARDVVLLHTTDSSLRQQALTEGINTHITEPLAELIHKPKRDVLGLLKDFSLDSTVIGGLLTITDVTTASAVGLAMAAGALSVGSKYLVNERQSKQELPAPLLIEGMQRAGIKEQEMVAQLSAIALNSVDFPGHVRDIEGHN